jgi:pimeloyl-ACP methyl ester carboxylesterase
MMHPDFVVYFAHGKESGPWGTKIRALADVAREKGFHVESPDYQFSHDPLERIEHLVALNPSAKKGVVLAGSSMGGYVTARAAHRLGQVDAVFLMAPALYLPGYPGDPKFVSCPCSVVHGLYDDVVPVDHSVRFARAHQAELHLLQSGHTLTDQIPVLNFLFARMLDAVMERSERA